MSAPVSPTQICVCLMHFEKLLVLRVRNTSTILYYNTNPGGFLFADESAVKLDLHDDMLLVSVLWEEACLFKPMG